MRRARGADDRHRPRAARSAATASRSAAGRQPRRASPRTPGRARARRRRRRHLRGPRLPAAARGRLLPVAVDRRPGHVPLRRPGRRPAARPTSPSPSRPASRSRRSPTIAADGIRHGSRGPPALARCSSAPGEDRELCWTIWSTDRPAPDRDPRRGDRRAPSSRRCSRPSRASPPTRARPPTTPGSAARRRSPATTSCSTSCVKRSVADLRLLINDGPGPGPALRRGRRARGSPRCSAATRHHRVPVARVPAAARRRDARPCWPPTRPPRTTRGATPSPARSSTSCGPARWPGPGSCRTRRTTARSTRRRCG